MRKQYRLSDLLKSETTGGIECRKCGCRHFETARTVRLPGQIRRERVCRHCGHRVFTVETVAVP